MRPSAAMVLAGFAAFATIGAGASLLVGRKGWDVRCQVVSDVHLSFFEGARARLLPSRRAGFEVEGEVRGGELVGTGDIGAGRAVIAVDRASVVPTELVGGRTLRCREPVVLVPRSAEVEGVVLGPASHVEGCGIGADAEGSTVDPRDNSFFFYGEPGSCELRACRSDGICGPPLRLSLEHERSVVVEVEPP